MKENKPIRLTRRQILMRPIEHAKNITYAVGDVGIVIGGLSLGLTLRKTFEAQDLEQQANPPVYIPFRPGSGIYVRSTETPSPDTQQAMMQKAQDNRENASKLFRTSLLGLLTAVPAFILLLKEAREE